jgi:ABC-type transport system involved in cytochrome bd biosynthesis fused ATPase/permease subunit
MLALLMASVRDMERLFEDWRWPLIALAVGGFVLGVLGHLFSSRTAIITGIMLVFMAVLIFPVALYIRGMP